MSTNPYVLGVDPGTTSLGWAVINTNTLELEAHGCFYLRARKELQGNDALLTTEMWRFWVDVIWKLPCFPGRCVVEQNAMNRLYSNVEMCILSFAVVSGMEIAAVHPMTWKSMLHVKATGNHHKNKLESLEFVRLAGYKVPNNHVADAVCMALCACEQ